ncbi:hypothetical protein ABMA46_10225 [Mesorhizobium sp. CN5-321]|uniref:hypothetical protein n=1 Tax=Mesorhizobium hunchu TaxID=3157708 RepID=UPI0032B71C4C
MNFRNILPVALPLLLAGCAGSAASLEAQTDAVTLNASGDYRSVYERLATTAKRCWDATGMYQSGEVEDDIYPSLGYGTISVVVNNMGSRTFELTAKIEDAGESSKISVHSNHRTYKKDFLRWASGDLTCS